MKATEQLNDFATRRSQVHTALDQCGIGNDLDTRFNAATEEIAKFCADLQARCTRQALYNLTTNVPCGIMRHADATPQRAIKSALAGACGALVKWDITLALELAADIAEDVNAHGEARAIRAMAQQEVAA